MLVNICIYKTKECFAIVYLPWLIKAHFRSDLKKKKTTRYYAKFREFNLDFREIYQDIRILGDNFECCFLFFFITFYMDVH